MGQLYDSELTYEELFVRPQNKVMRTYLHTCMHWEKGMQEITFSSHQRRK